jgi:uncharacterized membrane protein (DUF485 family)
MKIDSNDVAPIIGAIAALLTVVGGFVVQIVMTMRQNKKMDEHTAAIRQDIAVVHTGQTGVQKTLPGP